MRSTGSWAMKEKLISIKQTSLEYIIGRIIFFGKDCLILTLGKASDKKETLYMDAVGLACKTCKSKAHFSVCEKGCSDPSSPSSPSDVPFGQWMQQESILWLMDEGGGYPLAYEYSRDQRRSLDVWVLCKMEVKIDTFLSGRNEASWDPIVFWSTNNPFSPPQPISDLLLLPACTRLNDDLKKKISRNWRWHSPYSFSDVLTWQH